MQTIKSRRTNAILITLAVSAAISPAHAQESESLALDTITVTAQKRQQSDLDVPISMTVLDASDLEKTHGNALQDIQQLVPSFSLERGAAFNALTIRGVGGGGNTIGFDPRVGVYLDGIYMGQAQALSQPLFDIEQIEVLRGPQGNLFGRNTVAGVVNITTRAPTDKLEGYVRGVVGSKGTHEDYATISGPISENVLGKISLAAESRDGFIRNLYDANDLDDLRRLTARGQLVLTPNERLRIRLATDASDTQQKVVLGEPVTDMFGMPLLNGPLPKRTVNFNTTPDEKAKLAGGSVTADYTLDNRHILTAILGYRNMRQDLLLDSDYTAADLLRLRFKDHFDQYSEEIRIASPNTGKARYVAGLYHLDETANTDRRATIGVDAATTLVRSPGIPFPVPFTVVAGTFVGAEASLDSKIETETTALFGSLDYDLTTALTLNLGARYTHETKGMRFNLDGSQSGNFAIGSLSNYHDSRTENNLSPTVGATYKINSDQNVYAKYSQGFKSGGWNTDFISANAAKNPAFDSETVNSYEVGSKGRLLDGRVRYDLAVYLSRFKNFQVSEFVNLGGGSTSIELKNAAAVESRGLDAALALRAASNLDLGYRFGLNKALFDSYGNCSVSVDCTGHDLPYAPHFTSALTADYGMRLPNLNGKLDLYGEYSYHGKSFSSSVNDPAIQRIPSRELVNVRVGYLPDNSHWDFSLWARNLFDHDTIATRDRDFLGNLTVHRVDMRTVGLEGKYSFY